MKYLGTTFASRLLRNLPIKGNVFGDAKLAFVLLELHNIDCS